MERFRLYASIVVFFFAAFVPFTVTAGSPVTTSQLILPEDEVVFSYKGSTLWTSIQGIDFKGDYAYCLMPFGLSVLDISDPSMPQEVARLFIPVDTVHRTNTLGSPGAQRGLSISGNYAFVTGQNMSDGELFTVDISDPANPSIVGSVFVPYYPATDVVVDDNIAYVISGLGLFIFDVSVPEAPVEVGSLESENPHTLTVDGDLLFMDIGKDIAVVDVSDSSNPTIISTCPLNYNAYELISSGDFIYCATGYPRNIVYVVDVSDSLNLTVVHEIPDCKSITVSGDYAYIAEQANGNYLTVLDVADPSNPVFQGSFDSVSYYSYTMEFWNNHVYVGATSGGSLSIFDVTIPTSPNQVGNFYRNDGVNHVDVVDNFAYVSCGRNGLKIVDVSDPLSPMEVGTFDTPGRATMAEVRGDTVFIADTEEGIQIIDVSTKQLPTFIGEMSTSLTARDLTVVGDYAYLIDASVGLVVADISNLSSPFIVSTCSISGTPMSIKVRGNYAYVIDNTDWDLNVIDISNPLLPAFVDSIAIGDAISFDFFGDYAFVATDGDSSYVVDFSNPTMPSIVSSLYLWGYHKDILVSGDYAYLASPGGIIQTINISNPLLPLLVGTSFTPGLSSSIAFSEGGLVVADTWGLTIMSSQAVGTIEGNCSRSNLNSSGVGDSVLVTVSKGGIPVGSSYSNRGDNGYYYIDHLPLGLYDVEASRQYYKTTTFTDVEVVVGSPAQLDIVLEQEYPISDLFAPQENYPTRENPERMTSADFDNDGDIDLAVIHGVPHWDSLYIMLNDGNGVFGEPSPYLMGVTSGYPMRGIEAGDFDKDGDSDVVLVTMDEGSIAVMLNDGSGQFSFAGLYGNTHLDRPLRMSVEDFDSDGDPDIAVTNSGHDSLTMMLNNGLGTSFTSANYVLALGSSYLVTGDIDLDGDLDVVTSGYDPDSGLVNVLFNNGNATLSPPIPNGIPFWWRFLTMALVDIDNDLDLDLVGMYPGYDNDHIVAMYNDGYGAFTGASKFDVGHQNSPGNSLVAADFDRDGEKDLSLVLAQSPHIAILENNGDGTFADAEYANAGDGLYSTNNIEAADFDGDGNIDLAVLDNTHCDCVSILLNTTICDDSDTDGVCATEDNCLETHNPEQTDGDQDGVGDLCDNCPGDANDNQLDSDQDGAGDACDVCPDDAFDDSDSDGFCADFDNCPTIYNPSQDDTNFDGIGDACTFDAATPIGQDVAIDLGTEVAVTFDDVATGGTTEMTVTGDGPLPTSTFTIVPASAPAYYNITTTASFSGLLEICIYYDDFGMTQAQEDNLTLQHFDGIEWVNTTTTLDTETNIICGKTSTLSPFVIGFPAGCCISNRGNANSDPGDNINIADITFLVSYLFGIPTGPSPVCVTEANANSDPGENVNIADITYLVNYLFGIPSGPAPPACP